MDKYIYKGPVVVFNNVVDNNWYGVTWAATPAKARSNLMYQWKKANGRTASSYVKLPGELVTESDYGRKH